MTSDKKDLGWEAVKAWYRAGWRFTENGWVSPNGESPSDVIARLRRKAS